jgi:hypothetical protein
MLVWGIWWQDYFCSVRARIGAGKEPLTAFPLRNRHRKGR